MCRLTPQILKLTIHFVLFSSQGGHSDHSIVDVGGSLPCSDALLRVLLYQPQCFTAAASTSVSAAHRDRHRTDRAGRTKRPDRSERGNKVTTCSQILYFLPVGLFHSVGCKTCSECSEYEKYDLSATFPIFCYYYHSSWPNKTLASATSVCLKFPLPLLYRTNPTKCGFRWILGPRESGNPC